MKYSSPKISVIVPVYNAEHFLPKCIDSLLSQSMTDFEALLINDGSTDASGAICDEYAQKDVRIRVIHKQNGGAGAARNLALTEAKGEWIVFVDADDWVDKNYLNDLYENIITDTPQGLVIQGLKFYKNEKDIKSLNFASDTYTSQNIIDIFEEKQIQYYGYPFSKLYDLSIIKENNLTFDESAKIAEDLLFLLSYIPHTGYIRFISGANYNYLFHPESLSKKYIPFDSMYEVYKKCCQYMDNIYLTYNINNDNTFTYINRHQAELLTRSVLALYHPRHFRPKKERLAIIKTLSEKEKALIVSAYYHPLFILRINKFILKNNWYNLFDIYNRTLFFVREKLKGIGIKYLMAPIRKP